MVSPADSLLDHFSHLPDPRREQGQQHRLLDILVIAVCGAICGADTWVAIAQLGQAKYDWLKTFLDLPNGIPSHDPFGRVFARISPWAFQDCFSAWVQSLLPKLEDEIIPIDGKRLHRSYDRATGKATIHLVNAWAVKNRLVLGQFHCAGSLEEIRTIPELLRVLALKGCIVTVDALGCHKSTAAQIIDQQGDYVLAVKENHPKLLAHVRQVFDGSERQRHRDLSVDYWETYNEHHGRIETWT
jgi:predicted transposase YbfD/YdcC